MAKYERALTGDFDSLLCFCMDAVVGGSLSATLEDGSDYAAGGIRVAVRVFERYSMFGGNRVSLSLTLVGSGNQLFLSAITAGGSQAVLFKVNTLGEEAFLETLIDAVEGYYP